LLTLAADSNLSSAARKQAKPKPQDRKLKAYPKTNITYRPHGANQAGRSHWRRGRRQSMRRIQPSRAKKNRTFSEQKPTAKPNRSGGPQPNAK